MWRLPPIGGDSQWRVYLTTTSGVDGQESRGQSCQQKILLHPSFPGIEVFHATFQFGVNDCTAANQILCHTRFTQCRSVVKIGPAVLVGVKRRQLTTQSCNQFQLGQ